MPLQGFAKDNEPKRSNTCLMTRVQTSSAYKSTGPKRLDRDVVGSSSRCTPAPADKALRCSNLVPANPFQAVRLDRECSLPSHSVGVRDFCYTVLSVCGCPQSALWPGGRPCRDGQFYTERLSATSPQTHDERVLLMGDINAVVGSVRSEAIGGVAAETESQNGSRFPDLWTRTACAQSTHMLATAAKRGMRMAPLQQFETTLFAVTNLCSLLLCRVVSWMKWHSVKTHALITEPLPFLFTPPRFSFKPVRGREFAHVLLPKSVESYVATRGGKKPSSSACHVLFQNTSKLTRHMRW